MIIPVYKEADNINSTIDSVLKIKGEHSLEIIVVDGDSEGATINCITERPVIRLTSPKGRGVQMNRGAGRASGDILLFLHADTTLPEKAFEEIKDVMAEGKYVGGAFSYAIQSNNLFLRYLYYTSYLRSCGSRIAYGDQAVFLGRDYFERIGGFPEIPVMEDVAIMKKIKKNKDKIYIINDGVNTSTRRFEEDGIFYNWMRNYKLRILYYFGVSPDRLAKSYPDTRRAK
ncbi:MAG: glycosyltransferase family 2 protein [bacterium]|nr:glycosyltransferase family 2 protein [bacterium]